MQILDLFIAPFLLILLMAIAYLYVFGGSEWGITKKLIKWSVIFILFNLFARMFIPH